MARRKKKRRTVVLAIRVKPELIVAIATVAAEQGYRYRADFVRDLISDGVGIERTKRAMKVKRGRPTNDD